MKFDWSRLTEDDYNKTFRNNDDFLGQVYVGDICIELVLDNCGTIIGENHVYEEFLLCNFYVAHEDTGYGYKDDILPYDYADGFNMDIPYDLSYGEFKIKAEEMFAEYITNHNEFTGWNYEHNECVKYSLLEHANRPLEIW